MTNKIIILGADRQWEEDTLLTQAKDKNYTAEFWFLADIAFVLSDDIRWYFKGQPIEDVLSGEEIFIMRRSRGGAEKMIHFVNLLNRLNIKHTDHERSIASNLNKFHSLPTIKSTLCPHPNPTYIIHSLCELESLKLHFPLVSKPVMGRHGEGILFHETPETLHHIFDFSSEPHIIQPALEIESEFRIFVVGHESLGAIKKIPAEGKKVANYASGAQFLPLDIPQEFHQEAIRICQEQKIDIGGVDIARTKDGHYNILEVNRCPEFKAFSQARNINVAGKIIDFIHTLSS